MGAGYADRRGLRDPSERPARRGSARLIPPRPPSRQTAGQDALRRARTRATGRPAVRHARAGRRRRRDAENRPTIPRSTIPPMSTWRPPCISDAREFFSGKPLKH